MTELEKLEQKLEEEIAKRDAAWVPGRAPRAWRLAVAEIEDLMAAISKIKSANQPKSTIPADWVDVDWDSYDDI